MEGVMREAGECDSPVCPVTESEKLEIHLDAAPSQPNMKHLYKTPRSEQTARPLTKIFRLRISAQVWR